MHRSSEAEGKLRKAIQQLEQASAREEQNTEKREQARFPPCSLIPNSQYVTQERDLELSKRTISDLRTQLSQIQWRYLELQEQIQPDDRVENLEKSLKGAQDRADSLDAH